MPLADSLAWFFAESDQQRLEKHANNPIKPQKQNRAIYLFHFLLKRDATGVPNADFNN